MVKCFIILGEINEKLLLPIFLVCAQVAYILINEYCFKEIKFNVLDMLMLSLGRTSIRFIPCILKISIGKTNESLRLTKKKKCLHLFFIMLAFLFLFRPRKYC